MLQRYELLKCHICVSNASVNSELFLSDYMLYFQILRKKHKKDVVNVLKNQKTYYLCTKVVKRGTII